MAVNTTCMPQEKGTHTTNITSNRDTFFSEINLLSNRVSYTIFVPCFAPRQYCMKMLKGAKFNSFQLTFKQLDLLVDE